MPSDLNSTPTVLSGLSVGGKDPNGTVFGLIQAGSQVSAPGGNFSVVTTSGGINPSGGISTSRITASSTISAQGYVGSNLTIQGGTLLSGVTLDMRTNAVIPSSVTYAGGATISGLTIGQWGFVFNASGFSIVFSSGKSAYFFGGSTLSAAIV